MRGTDGSILRIGNCSGFYGDRVEAAREMVEGGPLDVLTGDYLAELTMAILYRAKLKRPETGYAVTFLTQMEQVLGACLDRGIKVVANAGGLNPAGLAEALGAARRAARPPPARSRTSRATTSLDRLDGWQRDGHALAHLDRGRPLAELRAPVVTANAYLGGWGIAEALARGADVVVTGRVTDASLVVGPAAWRFGWRRDDWDRLAAAVVAGHIVECGAQCCGGNYAFFEEVPRFDRIGYPIVEMARRRELRRDEAPRHRRAGLGRHRHRPAPLRDRGAALREPRRHRALRHDPPGSRRARPRARQRGRAASPRRRRPSSASTTWAATGTR